MIRAGLFWITRRPAWQRGLIGAAIRGPAVVLLSETVRWMLGEGFFR